MRNNYQQERRITMTFEMAEYKYYCYLRDKEYVGELPYADKNTSMQTPEGDWLLKDSQGHKIAVVLKDGKVIA